MPPELVKNGEELRGPLSPATVRLLRLYRDVYRPVHAGGGASSWPFPRPDGSHWPVGRARAALMDLTAKWIGASVNPHLVRALLGQLVLEERPGAIGLAKDVLGHRLSATTERYYLRLDRLRSRRLLHTMLERRRTGGRGGEVR